jgi:hypothetical protein
MLRFFVNERQDDWSMFLGVVESFINNATTSATKLTPNEILYGFKLRNNLSALAQGITPREVESPPVLRALARAEAEDTVKHATFHMARNYNRRHKNLSLQVGEKAYLRLENGYKLRGIPKAKLGLQRVGPFVIRSRIGRHAYELQFPDTWKIHPAVSVAQLEPFKEDPFNRGQPAPGPVTVEGEEEYEVEATEMRGRGRSR